MADSPRPTRPTDSPHRRQAAQLLRDAARLLWGAVPQKADGRRQAVPGIGDHDFYRLRAGNGSLALLVKVATALGWTVDVRVRRDDETREDPNHA